MSNTKDILSIKGMLDAAEKIKNFASSIANPDELFNDSKTFDAICMNLVVIGEMADRISAKFKLQHSEIDWKDIKGLRNIIAHDYFGVDAEEIWGIVNLHIPTLIDSINKIIV